jgi:ribosomal protein L37E
MKYYEDEEYDRPLDCVHCGTTGLTVEKNFCACGWGRALYARESYLAMEEDAHEERREHER